MFGAQNLFISRDAYVAYYAIPVTLAIWGLMRLVAAVAPKHTHHYDDDDRTTLERSRSTTTTATSTMRWKNTSHALGDVFLWTLGAYLVNYIHNGITWGFMVFFYVSLALALLWAFLVIRIEKYAAALLALVLLMYLIMFIVPLLEITIESQRAPASYL